MENDNVEVKKMENEADLIEALKKTKEESVSKEQYQKILDENKRMIEAFVDGKTIQEEEQKKEKSIEELQHDLVNAKTNYDASVASLALRKKRLELDGVDNYLPNGANAQITDMDKESAERVAEVLQQCIDESKGNHKVFNALFESRLDDTILPMRKK